jgi:hypothetical protein
MFVSKRCHRSIELVDFLFPVKCYGPLRSTTARNQSRLSKIRLFCRGVGFCKLGAPGWSTSRSGRSLAPLQADLVRESDVLAHPDQPQGADGI